MAVRHGYGKIAGTDALVFAYDTGDTENSYKGRPAVNYGPADLASWNLESGDVKRIPTGNYYKGQPTYNCRTALGTSWIAINSTISGLRTAAGSSGTVTMSCMVRNNNPSPYSVYAYMGHDFGSTRTIPANSDWQKIQWTVNQSNMNNDYVEFRPYTNSADVYLEMTMPMVEVNVGNASQFVDGTRSATEGLLDLTGNCTVDLTNAAFTIDAQPTFDGTNTSIPITGLTISATQNKSYEAVVRLASNFVADGSILAGRRSTTNDFAIWGSRQVRASEDDQGLLSNSTLELERWYHVAYTFEFDGGTVATQKIYINGVLDAQTTQSNYIDGYVESTQYLGYDWRFFQYFNGDIASVKVYNKTLTAAEIQTNFNHYKTRYNL